MRTGLNQKERRWPLVRAVLLSWVLVLTLNFAIAAPAAWAHRPHDVIAQLELSPQFDSDRTLFVETRGNLFKSTDGGDRWQRLARGLDTRSSMKGLVVSQQTPDALYVATAGDGIYASQDGGETWQPASTGLENRDLNLLAIAPDDDQLLLAAGTERGIYRTADGGQSWATVADFNALSVLAFFPAGERAIAADGEGQLYRSEDAGETWEPGGKLDEGDGITAIAIAPDGETLWLATENGGIFTGSPDADEFTPANDGLNDPRVRDIALSPNFAADNALFASTWEDGFYLSTDGGATWKQSARGLTTDPQADEEAFLSPNFFEVRVPPGYPEDKTLYLSGFNGLFRSEDGGKTWAEVETLAAGSIVSLTVSPNYAEDSTLAVATYVGLVYISRDGGESWEPIDGGLEIPRLERSYAKPLQDPRRFFDIEFSPDFPKDNTLFASLLWSNFLRSEDTKAWEIIDLPKKRGFPQRGLDIATSPNFAADQTVYLGTQHGVFYTSENAGRNFEILTIFEKEFSNDSPSMAVSPNVEADSTLYAYSPGTKGIFKTTDGGQTWAIATEGSPLMERTNLQLAISPDYANDGTVLVGSDRGLFWTRDAGETWELVPALDATAFVEGVAISPNYASDRTFLVSLRGQGLFKTTDGGASFAQVYNGDLTLARLGNVPSAGVPIVFSPTFADDQTIFGFGGAEPEVFRSTDGGETWEVLDVPLQAAQYGPISTVSLFLELYRTKLLKLAAGLVAIAIAYFLLGFLKLERTWKAAIILLLVAGVVFRFVNLSERAYNADEVRSFYRLSGYTRQEVVEEAFNGIPITAGELQQDYQRPTANRDLGDALKALAGNPEHPPLYYLIARVCLQLFDDPASARVLSVIFGLALLPAAYWFCLELFGSSLTGWFAAGLLAISPYQILVAQAAREYSYWGLMSVVASAALLRALRLGGRWNWALYAVSLALGFYSHLFFTLVAFGHGLYVLIIQWRSRRSWLPYLVSTALGMLAFVPWILVVVTRTKELEEKTQWVRSETNSLGAIVGAVIQNLGNVFLDFNDSSRIEKFFDYGFALFFIYALYFLIRQTPTKVWLFLLFLLGLTAIAQIAPDILLAGRRAEQARYFVPSFIAAQVIVAYLLASYISIAAAKEWWRRLWQLIFLGFAVAGLISGVLVMKTLDWDYLDQGKTASAVNLLLAPEIDAADDAIVVSDATHSFVLALSYEVKPDRTFQLFESRNQEQWREHLDLPTLEQEYSQVLVYFPTTEFLKFIESEGYATEDVAENRLFRLSPAPPEAEAGEGGDRKAEAG